MSTRSRGSSRRAPRLEGLHAAPGNPGIAELGSCHPVLADDADGLLALATSPHRPRGSRARSAARGRARRPPAPRRRLGLRPVGGGCASRLQGFRGGARDRGRADGAALPVARAPWWSRPTGSRPDGASSSATATSCRPRWRKSAGSAAASSSRSCSKERASVFALCDGQRAVALAAARDYKRAEDGDAGPTPAAWGLFAGGRRPMGSMRSWTQIGPVQSRLAARGAPFSGLLYAGLVLTADGPRMLGVQLPIRRSGAPGQCCRAFAPTSSPPSPAPR